MPQEFSQVPANQYFRFSLVERSSEGACIRMEIGEDQIQEGGVLHGGIISAIADSASVHAFFADLDPNQMVTSIEFKVNFLRPAMPGKGTVEARSKVLRRGKKSGRLRSGGHSEWRVNSERTIHVFVLRSVMTCGAGALARNSTNGTTISSSGRVARTTTPPALRFLISPFDGMPLAVLPT